MSTSEKYEIWHGLRAAQGDMTFHLDVFGDSIAEREGYRSVDGIEAINFYLVQKFHWLPRDVLSMSAEDKLFVLSEEMHGWTVPVKARVARD